MPCTSVSKQVFMQNQLYENVFTLQVKFHAIETHFCKKVLYEDLFWNRGKLSHETRQNYWKIHRPQTAFFSAPCRQIWCCHRMYSICSCHNFTAEWFPLLKVNLEYYNHAKRILCLLWSWTGVTSLKAICSSNAHCLHDC